MLFNSFVFLLGFLPLSLAIYGLTVRYAPQARLSVLLVLSIVFYGWWDWRFIPLIVLSIAVNWVIEQVFLARKAGWIVTAAIAANLAVLGLFKYANFFAGLASAIPGLAAPKPDIALPLGISFFTFHHIMYLVDLRAGRAPRYDLVRYGLYIAFFPQVLAGPLVRWSEVMHQFDRKPYRPGWEEMAARGVILLVLGLAKKTLIGDPLAGYAEPVFKAAATGDLLTVRDAWSGVLAFTFQIYFDFSGYTDMALGLAMLFGIVLPQNFNVPYRSVSLQDFWRRWHMTLSRFLRDYLYIPLGGNRHGFGRQMLALTATMTLGGLWHGAGLTFTAWGLAHGVGLAAGVLWRRADLPFPRPLGRVLTFAFVVLTWVLFRAESFEAAARIYKAMFGFAPAGSGFKWRVILLAAVLSMVGPTAYELAQRAPPRRWIAAALAVLFAVVLLKIGDDANYEFIYFQF
jgi:D-alanyl-lipoteichoic acid acyltransferase DltB (MBOAT superfamily)